ncbi:MAG: hypothetical protein HC772_02725 [Leptolyngbyaceae cyanobacterium CRU_2_3]|nr:hypothetical protein [Leptolyngbyaceae cyanobacterium CRU_2_3]
MSYPSSQGSASTRKLDTQPRLQIHSAQSNLLNTARDTAQSSTSRNRASSTKQQGFRFLKAPALQVQSSGNQTLGGNTIGNAQNLGNLSGKSAYSRNDIVGANNASDFFKFALSKNSNFKLSLGKLTGNADLRLLKSNGDTLTKSTRSGTQDETLQGKLKAGTYYIQVSTNDNNASYSLNLKGSGKSLDAGNSQSAALDAGNLSRTQRRYSGQVGSRDVDDYYRVTLSEGGSIKLLASGISGDVDLQLLNGNGAVLGKSTNQGKANESISQNVGAGTYFVRVSPFSNAKSNYTLDMASNYTGNTNNPIASPTPSSTPGSNPTPSSNPTGDPGNTLGSAEVKSSAAFSRTQQVNQDDQDFYRFSVSQSGVFTANLSGLTGDADVKLIQDKNNNGAVDPGEVLGWQWEWSTGNESIRRFLQAGNYFVEVMGYGSSVKDYTLNTNFKAQGSDDRKFSLKLNYKDGLSNVSSAVRTALENATKIWESVIPYSSFNGAHTLNVDVVGINSSQEWLAAATNTGGQTDANGKWMPTTGTIRINTSYSSTYNNNPEYLKEVVTHELGHVLGIGTLWEKNGRSLIDRSTNTYKADSYAGRAYGEVTNTLQPTAIPVEAGSYGHWDENKLQDELMTPFAESLGTKMPLSQVTIASLRDIGWNVNYGAADTYNTTLALMSPIGLSQDQVTSTSTGTSTGSTKCRCPICAGATEALGLNLVGSTSLTSAIGIS